MHRRAAILLFWAFLLPFAAPLLALGQNAEAGLPACCRRDGAHHCAMGMAERSAEARDASQEPHWQAPAMRCPFAPASVASPHAQDWATPAAALRLIGFGSHPSSSAQTGAKRRIARDRARHKRGPPAVSFS